MDKTIKPLYRKVNTRARHHHHNVGSDAKHDRNTKKGLSKSMKKNDQRGLDFSPLYKFLLSKVGEDWEKIHSEAVSRIPKGESDAIFHIVRLESVEYNDKLSLERGYTRVGESTLFSILTVDENNKLQFMKPELRNENLYPTCDCCTHSFNGKVLINKFKKEIELNLNQKNE